MKYKGRLFWDSEKFLILKQVIQVNYLKFDPIVQFADDEVPILWNSGKFTTERGTMINFNEILFWSGAERSIIRISRQVYELWMMKA